MDRKQPQVLVFRKCVVTSEGPTKTKVKAAAEEVRKDGLANLFN
jgi:hypothetical protein